MALPVSYTFNFGRFELDPQTKYDDLEQYENINPEEIANVLLDDILEDIEEFASPSPEDARERERIAAAQKAVSWAPFCKDGAIFARYVKDKYGDVIKEFVRIWCEGTHILWCDAKLPTNTPDDSRVINTNAILSMSQGFKDMVATEADSRKCFSLSTTRHSWILEAPTSEERNMWYFEIKRICNDGRQSQTTRRPSMSSAASAAIAASGAGSDSRPTTPSGRRASVAQSESRPTTPVSRRASTVDSPPASVEDKSPEDEAKAIRDRMAAEADKRGTQSITQRLMQGSPFEMVVFDEESNGYIRVAVTLFLVIDATNPPPGHVYWIEQDANKLEPLPNRGYDTRKFIKVVMGKTTPELQSHAARDFDPNLCATFHFEGGRYISVYSISVTISLWSNALTALQLESQSETISKREVRTQKLEEKQQQEKFEERKQMDEVNNRQGFAQDPRLNATEMMTTQKRELRAAVERARRLTKVAAQRAPVEAQQDRFDDFSGLICFPPQPASELTPYKSWFQTVCDVKYGIKKVVERRAAVNLANTGELPHMHSLNPKDYKSVEVLDSYAGCNARIVPRRTEFISVECKEYAGRVFDTLRLEHGIDNDGYLLELSSPESFVNVVATAKNENDAKDSGIFYWISARGEYLVKGIDKDQFKFILSILPQYAQYIVDSAQDSLLPRIFGMYRFRNSQHHNPIYLVIMKNSLCSPHYPTVRYEIKGSTLGRDASERERTQTVPVLKDNDISSDVSFFLRPDQRQLIEKQIESDIRFLQSINCMDYAIMAAFYDAKQDPSNPLSDPTNPESPKYSTAAVAAAKGRKTKLAPPRESDRVGELWGLRDREVEIKATEDVNNNNVSQEDTNLYMELCARLPSTVKLVPGLASKSTLWSLDDGGVATALWDRRRNVHKADGDFLFITFTGAFQNYSTKKSWERWFKRNQIGASCVEPGEYAERLLTRAKTLFNHENAAFTRRGMDKKPAAIGASPPSSP